MKKTLIVLLVAFTAFLSMTACSGVRAAKEIIIRATPKTLFYVGEDIASFNNSLKDGKIILRFTNDTDSEEIAMNSDKITLSGFDTSTEGSRHIIVKHVDYPTLEARFSITVVGVEQASFKVEDKPTIREYFFDVEPEDIDLAGGSFIITNNNGSESEETAMTADNVSVHSIIKFTENGSSTLKANVNVQLKGTFMVASYEITLKDVFVTDFEIKKQPLYSFYTTDEEQEISLDGIEIEFTRNSTKKFTATNIDVLEAQLDLDNSRIALTLPEITGTNAQAAITKTIPIFVLDDQAVDSVLAADFMEGLDWSNYSTVISADDKTLIRAAFASLANLTATQRDNYSIIKDYINSIVATAFYVDVIDINAEIAAENKEDAEELFADMQAYNAFKNIVLARDTTTTPATTTTINTLLTSIQESIADLPAAETPAA